MTIKRIPDYKFDEGALIAELKRTSMRPTKVIIRKTNFNPQNLYLIAAMVLALQLETYLNMHRDTVAKAIGLIIGKIL